MKINVLDEFEKINKGIKQKTNSTMLLKDALKCYKQEFQLITDYIENNTKWFQTNDNKLLMDTYYNKMKKMKKQEKIKDPLFSLIYLNLLQKLKDCSYGFDFLGVLYFTIPCINRAFGEE